MINIDELLELEAKATPGEWRILDHGTAIGTPESDICFASCGHDPRLLAKEYFCNIKLIGAMRNNIKPLLEELKAARKVVGAAKELIRGNDLLDQESVMMKDVDLIRASLKELEGGEK